MKKFVNELFHLIVLVFVICAGTNALLGGYDNPHYIYDLVFPPIIATIIVIIISALVGGLISLLHRKWTFIGTTGLVLKWFCIIFSLFVVIGFKAQEV